MSQTDVFIGIDTSCYTTSTAVLDRQGSLLAEERRVLNVKNGQRGLAQSEMIFQHTRNLPELLEIIFARHDLKVAGIGVTNQPRPLDSSYMPAFLSGAGCARTLACVLNVPLFLISHQENHLEAALWSVMPPTKNRLLMLHASGGTTDFLLVDLKINQRHQLTNVGGSIDLQGGQFIDRVGVALGLSFPAGAALEKLARSAAGIYSLPVAVKGGQISFSGPATAALRAIDAETEPANIARGVEAAIASSFATAIINISKELEFNEVIVVGGISANIYIRETLTAKLRSRGMKTYFPKPAYSTDNAVGCAAAALRLSGVEL